MDHYKDILDSYSELPPPYSQEDVHPPRRDRDNDLPNQSIIPRKSIPRKPVHSGDSRPRTAKSQHGPSLHTQRSVGGLRLGEDKLRERSLNIPQLPPRPGLLLDTSGSPKFTDQQLYLSPATAHSNTDLSTLSPSASVSSFTPTTSSSNPNSSISPADPKKTASAYVQKAFREARYFTGGLIKHPTESTKHYTILRHSHGLVFYQGVATTLAVSIFSDRPLPEDRTIWLQSKGWSGKRGMRARAFIGMNSNWINVTPSTPVGPEQLKPEDERAWQRDIAKFKKSGNRNVREKHILRETAVVRIPAEAGDGYFELVLCLGEKKKVLCTSPTFRVLSTSTSPHSIRGASLSTLPLEMGAMALGVYARNTAGRVVGPVTSAVQSKVQKCMPSWWTEEAVLKTYERSGVSGTVSSTIENGNSQYIQTRDGSYTTAGAHDIVPEQGPQPPYPIKFSAHSQLDQLGDDIEHGVVPVIHLHGIPEHICQRLHGYYFGWARPRRTKGSQDDSHESWRQIIITALLKNSSQLARADIAELNSREFTLYLLDVFEPRDDKTPIEIRIMGFIRPDEPIQRATLKKGLQEGDEDASEAAVLTEANDISFAQSILNHPNWNPHSRPDMGRSESSLEKITAGYANARMAAQRTVDRVPFNAIGVRMPVDVMREKALVSNGYFVRR